MPDVTISLTSEQIAAIPNNENTVAFVQRKMRGMLDRLGVYNVDRDFERFTNERKAAIVAAEKAR